VSVAAPAKKFLDPRRLLFVARDVLKDCSYGVKYEEDTRVFVSPAIYSLIQSDRDKTLGSLRICLFPGKPILDGTLFVGLL
jgi:hypothetical protein